MCPGLDLTAQARTHRQPVARHTAFNLRERWEEAHTRWRGLDNNKEIGLTGLFSGEISQWNTEWWTNEDWMDGCKDGRVVREGVHPWQPWWSVGLILPNVPRWIVSSLFLRLSSDSFRSLICLLFLLHHFPGFTFVFLFPDLRSFLVSACHSFNAFCSLCFLSPSLDPLMSHWIYLDFSYPVWCYYSIQDWHKAWSNLSERKLWWQIWARSFVKCVF